MGRRRLKLGVSKRWSADEAQLAALNKPASHLHPAPRPTARRIISCSFVRLSCAICSDNICRTLLALASRCIGSSRHHCQETRRPPHGDGERVRQNPLSD